MTALGLASDGEKCGPRVASSRLMSGALAGLLCLSATSCGSDSDSTDAAEITTQTRIENLDEAGFKALCDERHGTVEVMAHCGGLATAPGFSYDTTTSLLSEHTCKGANTCSGWNCVTDE